MTRAGELRHRITIERPGPGAIDSDGNMRRDWRLLYANVPARVRPRTARELFAQGRTIETASHEVVLRWLPGIDSECRIHFDGRILRVRGVIDRDEKKRILELDCSEESA